MIKEKIKQKKAVIQLRQISQLPWIDQTPFPYHQFCTMHDPLPITKKTIQTLTPRSHFRQRVPKNQNFLQQKRKKIQPQPQQRFQLSNYDPLISKKSPSKYIIKIQMNQLFHEKTKINTKLKIDGSPVSKHEYKQKFIENHWNKSLMCSPTHKKRFSKTARQERSLSLSRQ